MFPGKRKAGVEKREETHINKQRSEAGVSKEKQSKGRRETEAKGNV